MGNNTFQIKADELEIFKFIGNLKEEKETFSISRTGYTVSVKWAGNTYLFAPEKPSSAFLFFLAKLKSCVKGKAPEINRTKITYYLFNQPFNPSGEMYLVDLNSAYLQALKNAGIITDEVYSYGQKLAKKDRLKGVGALATVKTIYQVEEGIIRTPEIKEAENADIFFFACEIVGRLFFRISQKYPSFLFFWVDGIYFSSRKEAEEALEYCEAENYPAKLQVCTEAKIKGNTLFYRLDGKPKIFSLPEKDDKITDERIINFLINGEL